eukprot:scaffold6838_cov36-Phaeocystis_antarctica.AAC.2
MGVIFVESDGAPGADRACMSIALKQPKTARAAKRAAWPAAVADSREVSHSLGGRSCGEIVGVIPVAALQWRLGTRGAQQFHKVTRRVPY